MPKTLTDEQAKTAQAFIRAFASVEAIASLTGVPEMIASCMRDNWGIESPGVAVKELLEAVE